MLHGTGWEQCARARVKLTNGSISLVEAGLVDPTQVRVLDGMASAPRRQCNYPSCLELQPCPIHPKGQRTARAKRQGRGKRLSDSGVYGDANGGLVRLTMCRWLQTS